MGKETTLAYIKDIAIRLNDPAIYGGASLMIGAGFSKNAEGIGTRKTPPDWSELAMVMYDELCKRFLQLNWTDRGGTVRIIKPQGSIRSVRLYT